jgi:hypothetical protein
MPLVSLTFKAPAHHFCPSLVTKFKKKTHKKKKYFTMSLFEFDQYNDEFEFEFENPDYETHVESAIGMEEYEYMMMMDESSCINEGCLDDKPIEPTLKIEPALNYYLCDEKPKFYESLNKFVPNKSPIVIRSYYFKDKKITNSIQMISMDSEKRDSDKWKKKKRYNSCCIEGCLRKSCKDFIPRNVIIPMMYKIKKRYERDTIYNICGYHHNSVISK